MGLFLLSFFQLCYDRKGDEVLPAFAETADYTADDFCILVRNHQLFLHLKSKGV